MKKTLKQIIFNTDAAKTTSGENRLLTEKGKNQQMSNINENKNKWQHHLHEFEK